MTVRLMHALLGGSCIKERKFHTRNIHINFLWPPSRGGARRASATRLAPDTLCPWNVTTHGAANAGHIGVSGATRPPTNYRMLVPVGPSGRQGNQSRPRLTLRGERGHHAYNYQSAGRAVRVFLHPAVDSHCRSSNGLCHRLWSVGGAGEPVVHQGKLTKTRW